MKKYLFITAMSLIFMACNKDFLDRGPKDALSPKTFWKTQKDLDLALTALYRDFQSSEDLLYRDCGSDNAYNNFPWEGWQPIGNGTLSATNTGSSYFSYRTIAYCNEFIKSAPNVALSNLDVYLAQARFIRAYKYYQLTTNYGDVPLILDVIPSPEEAKVPRDAKEKIKDFIEKELKEIIPILPATYSNAEYGKATKGAAQALLARFYLYYGKYSEALNVAQSIQGYSLVSSYSQLFDPNSEQNNEVILSVQQVSDFYEIDFTPYLPNSVGGWSSVVPTQSLVDSYEMLDGTTIEEAIAAGTYDPTNPYVNRDPRLRATILYPGTVFWGSNVYSSCVSGNIDFYSKADNASKTGYNFCKYTRSFNASTPFYNMGTDVFIFRYAEILLTIAEAKVELNQIDDQLYDCIDAIRQRAGMPKVDRTKYANQAKLRELVRRERRVEFAGEGLRRDDIIRWKIAKDVMNTTLKGVKKGVVLTTQAPNGDYNVKLTEDANVIETRTFADKNYLLPIPQSSRDKNDKLTQNDGYGS